GPVGTRLRFAGHQSFHRWSRLHLHRFRLSFDNPLCSSPIVAVLDLNSPGHIQVDVVAELLRPATFQQELKQPVRVFLHRSTFEPLVEHWFGYAFNSSAPRLVLEKISTGLDRLSPLLGEFRRLLPVSVVFGARLAKPRV